MVWDLCKFSGPHNRAPAIYLKEFVHMDKNVQFGEVEDKAGKAEGGRLHYIHVYHSLVFWVQQI